jgi:signal transduction histidine kinase
MAKLPKFLLQYIEEWLPRHYTMGYILLDAESRIKSWGGELEKLGIGALNKGCAVMEQLLFTEGLFPFSEPSIYLPMVKIQNKKTLDVHLVRKNGGYGLLLMDVSKKEKQWSKYQQQMNELAVSKKKQGMSSSYAMSSLKVDTIENFFKACNTAALLRERNEKFTLIGQAPEWLHRFCPDVAIQPCNLSPENYFSFLENFLLDAHDFWSEKRVGCLKSGIWIEVDNTGRELLFEAIAVHTGEYEILLILNDNSLTTEKQVLIQKGRELALGHDTLEKNQLKLKIDHDALEQQFNARRQDAEQAEERLEAEVVQRHQLEQERTEILSQLQQAQKMEAIGTLAGGIAHDFNNILSAVVGFTELSLFEVPKESKLATNLQQVLSATQRAKALIRQILTFSRQSNPETRPIQFVKIIEEALTLLRASLPATVEINKNFQSQAYVMADPSQLDQVVMNLCTNAGHAMMDEGGVLEIGLQDKKIMAGKTAQFFGIVPGKYIELTVKDNGSGMTKDTLNRIFDPFFTTKKKGEGTGMGLSVVHGIVKNCKGGISVDSQVGKGTCFHIILPIVNPIEIPETISSTTMPRGTENILFIDDEPAQVDLALNILPPLGYHVTAMTESENALKAFTQAPDDFDIVVTDMYMPKLTGKGLAIEMLKIRPHLPIILCSGYSIDLVAPTSLDKYFKGHLMKPVLLKEMAEMIRNVLDEK